MSTDVEISKVEENYEEFHIPKLHDSDEDSDNEVNLIMFIKYFFIV